MTTLKASGSIRKETPLIRATRCRLLDAHANVRYGDMAARRRLSRNTLREEEDPISMLLPEFRCCRELARLYQPSAAATLKADGPMSLSTERIALARHVAEPPTLINPRRHAIANVMNW